MSQDQKQHNLLINNIERKVNDTWEKVRFYQMQIGDVFRVLDDCVEKEVVNGPVYTDNGPIMTIKKV